MKINGFIWIGEIIEKLEQKHHIQQTEVEALTFPLPLFPYRCIPHHMPIFEFRAKTRSSSAEKSKVPLIKI